MKVIQCPKCQQRMKVEAKADAVTVTCPGCQTLLKLPATPNSPPPSSPPQPRLASAANAESFPPNVPPADANPFVLDHASNPDFSQGPNPNDGQTPFLNPYQVTVSTASQPYATQLPSQRSRKPLRTLCTAITILILLTSVGSVVLSTIETIGAAMFETFNDPNAEVSSELESALLGLNVIVAILAAFAYFIGGIVSLVFLYRSNANLHASNVRNMQYTPGWAVGYWFIPILNLVKPYHVTKEIWERSAGPDNANESSLLGAWWACWIIGNILNRLETRIPFEDLGAFALPLSWASTLVSLAAGLCFIVIVRGITKRQGF